MAYNPYFPMSYQPQMYQQPQQQLMTPPTIHAEIVQVDNEQAAANYPVGAGASQMMIARDDSAIYVKTALANGQISLEVFEKRAPVPAEPAINPGDYVRRDEIEDLIAAAMSHKKGSAEK